MNAPKIGFHIAANCGGCTGIEVYWRALNDAAIPFTVYAANDGGMLVQASRYEYATLVYRDVEASTVNPAHYTWGVEEATLAYWRVTQARLPLPIQAMRDRVWIELLNEPGREPEQAAWVGALMAGMAKLALADGYRVAGPGWAPGNPESEAWRTPEWYRYLKLCADYPDSVAVSLHEYSLDDDIHQAEGWLVGRFTDLYDACDDWELPRPTTFITECGWTLNSMPSDAQAKRDIAWLAGLYGAHPQIVSAHLWTLQSGRGNGDLPQRLNALMPWMTEYTLKTRFPDVEPGPVEPGDDMDNLLVNPSFEDGWKDDGKYTTTQHPNGWTVEWNIGAAFPNPHGGQPYLLGECVHKHKDMLPAAEQGAFLWDGEWTLKLFAGQRSFWARLKQTLTLPAGSYRLLTPVWVDCYSWDGGKDYEVEERQAEIMVKVGGETTGTWRPLKAGTKVETETLIIHPGGALNLAVHFRCNWAISNNLWLDGWSMESVAVPEPPPVKHKAIVVKLPQDMTAAEWGRAAAYAFPFRHTMTASEDDMMTILHGGNADSYVKLAYPLRQVTTGQAIVEAGYRWEPVFEEPASVPF